jgi:hypothetical protein
MSFTSASIPTTRDAPGDPRAAGRALRQMPGRAEPDGVLLRFPLRRPPGLPEPHPPNRATSAALAAEILTLLAGAYEPELGAEEQLDKTLHLSVRDDGVGGADPARGSGLIGLRDRVEAIGGTAVIHSPAGAGTTVVDCLPLDWPV